MRVSRCYATLRADIFPEVPVPNEGKCCALAGHEEGQAVAGGFGFQVEGGGGVILSKTRDASWKMIA
jgi:hypothetical protein